MQSCSCRDCVVEADLPSTLHRVGDRGRMRVGTREASGNALAQTPLRRGCSGKRGTAGQSQSPLHDKGSTGRDGRCTVRCARGERPAGVALQSACCRGCH
ncbi:hypothetical protein XAC3810_730220 [Xanthomonas citri pv. citri]|nr:hypothetical protein XAC9322_700221 [Xanthomonas citri pv. citri]CEJ47835.1 hypothetical protein XAB3213_3990062 [Xanthomonas citri pv. bilvae]CEE47172.1 hypothetical protein XAC3810_730220 [Xanthomonas citri pv. citri]CEE76226.1 hypothetical protein XACW160_710199 [Xanthomonas citri pv. citri]CEE85982.1 hypothetical protein XACLC80_890045 [Xanthomonas citri pv. citri]